MFFWYKYYDYLIKSNVELFNFDHAININAPHIIYINYIRLIPSQYKKNPKYNYVCYADVIFEIIIELNIINVISMDKYCFQEVIRNKPFAFFCYLNNRIILHASAIKKDNYIYAFCGAKGAGKTTMALYLSKYFSLFSDDQLSLFRKNKKIHAISPDNIQKVTERTANILSILNNCDDYNPKFEKYLYRSKNYTSSIYGEMKSIFVLRRSNLEEPRVELIRDHAHKVSLILANIVARSCFYDSLLLEKSIVENIAKIQMHYLYYNDFENSLSNSNWVRDEIVKLIIKQ